MYYVMELAPGGDLLDLTNARGKFSEKFVRHYMKQLISAFDQMHSNSICHRDIKLENLLLDKDLNLKLTDFGYADVVIRDGAII